MLRKVVNENSNSQKDHHHLKIEETPEIQRKVRERARKIRDDHSFFKQQDDILTVVNRKGHNRTMQPESNLDFLSHNLRNRSVSKKEISLP
jgi:hypothetical protein